MGDATNKQCPICLKWFMSRTQRDHHVEIRHKNFNGS